MARMARAVPAPAVAPATPVVVHSLAALPAAVDLAAEKAASVARRGRRVGAAVAQTVADGIDPASVEGIAARIQAAAPFLAPDAVMAAAQKEHRLATLATVADEVQVQGEAGMVDGDPTRAWMILEIEHPIAGNTVVGATKKVPVRVNGVVVGQKEVAAKGAGMPALKFGYANPYTRFEGPILTLPDGRRGRWVGTPNLYWQAV